MCVMTLQWTSNVCSSRSFIVCMLS